MPVTDSRWMCMFAHNNTLRSFDPEIIDIDKQSLKPASQPVLVLGL